MRCRGRPRLLTCNRMVVNTTLSDDLTDRVFHALADATRRDILTRTMVEEHSVSALARRYPMSVTAVQKHVAVLEAAHLVSRRKQGREQLVAAMPETLRAAHLALDQLETIWRARVARIGDILSTQATDTK